MKIKKAVITAAGLGTRVLPATKSMPKEMLPIVDKPAIQFIVEECVNAGITQILIILSRGKFIVEDHFDRSPQLEQQLAKGNKTDMLTDVINIANMADIMYVRQQEQLGLGHAISCAKNFVGDEPFAVLYGDDVIIGKTPAIKELCEAYDKYEKGTVGIKEVPTEDVKKYSSMKINPLDDGYFEIDDMIEKPNLEQMFSNYSILGRCILPPKIFDILENTPKGANNELQLTDAMKTLANEDGMIGVNFSGTRYDMGNKFGIMKAGIEVGLNHPEIADDLRKYIKELAKTL